MGTIGMTVNLDSHTIINPRTRRFGDNIIMFDIICREITRGFRCRAQSGNRCVISILFRHPTKG